MVDYRNLNLTEEEIEEIQHKKDLDDWEQYEQEVIIRELELSFL